ncbi:DNA (cytosine-5-)-methyltransferase [Paraburkholderia flagellata]|uniref:DNA (cytosine-5-)-methyltransferase n=1 Tax=Paraburkholderia flagellata TaxID=2883241 RepID=UPI001F20D269|nr:DNA (cytosine-5-)-methyltransferase [Paraburkholderia flagellata]
MSQARYTPTLNVIDLFAGIGGFRFGLEAVHGTPFKFTLSNQYEPGKKAQHASTVYRTHWPDAPHINEDIQKLLESTEGRQAIRDASPDVLCAGFPCQDYSVARPLSQSKGLAGKKGTLWWSIAQLLTQRNDDGSPVKYLLLENVDRLITSPANCRGRDFAVILSTLRALGYAAEWRVVNAAEYGHPQKRKRVFIVAYHETTDIYRRLAASILSAAEESILTLTLLFSAFPCSLRNPRDAVEPALNVALDPLTEQLTFKPLSNNKSPFGNCGLMLGGRVYTCNSDASALDDFRMFTGHTEKLTLADVVKKTGPVPTCFFIKPEEEARWQQAKGGKSVPRSRNGFEYDYKEGAMAFPDRLDRPARTIITSEGGTSPSRTKHAIRDASGLLRRLTPEELEELTGFPRGFTAIDGVSDVTRAMLLGNSLVTHLVRRIGEALAGAHTSDDELGHTHERDGR